MVARMRKSVACRHCGEPFVPQPVKPGYVNQCPDCLAERTAADKGTWRGARKSGTKKDQAITLLSRAEGATLSELMNKLGWQKHTVRGFISLLGSKYGYQVESTKPEGEELTYRINDRGAMLKGRGR